MVLALQDGDTRGEAIDEGIKAEGLRGHPYERLSQERRQLAAAHVGLVGVHLRQRVGRLWHGRSKERRDELFQVGCLALVKAAARYDPERNGVFASYALPRIRRAIHAALVGGESVIRVPYGIACRESRSAQRTRPKALSLWRGEGCGDLSGGSAEIDRDPGADTIGHALRERFQRATNRAVSSMSNRPWRRKDLAGVFSRVAAERVLVADRARRTPIRQLARELGIASGQITVYEQRIVAAIEEELRADPQVDLLLRFAREDSAGFDAPLDEEQRNCLIMADVRAFEGRFASLDRGRQAQMLYALVEQSTGRVAEVARNLYQLTLGHS